MALAKRYHSQIAATQLAATSPADVDMMAAVPGHKQLSVSAEVVGNKTTLTCIIGEEIFLALK